MARLSLAPLMLSFATVPVAPPQARPAFSTEPSIQPPAASPGSSRTARSHDTRSGLRSRSPAQRATRRRRVFPYWHRLFVGNAQLYLYFHLEGIRR
jgi:hypothetical protein